jgi:hypothetical protein
MAAAIRAAAEVAPLLALTGRALVDLGEGLGGVDAATLWLLELAEATGKPVGVNFATGDDTSSTAFVAPRTWTEQRLQGWIAGHHAELEDAFGEVTQIREFPAPGGAADGR